MDSWPAHRHEVRSWRQRQRGGSREDRTLTQVTVSLPPLIAARPVPITPRLAAEMEAAVAEIVALDQSFGDLVPDREVALWWEPDDGVLLPEESQQEEEE